MGTERARGIDACSKTRMNGPESDCIYSIHDLYAIDLRRALISAPIEGESLEAYERAYTHRHKPVTSLAFCSYYRHRSVRLLLGWRVEESSRDRGLVSPQRKYTSTDRTQVSCPHTTGKRRGPRLHSPLVRATARDAPPPRPRHRSTSQTEPCSGVPQGWSVRHVSGALSTHTSRATRGGYVGRRPGCV